MTDTTVSDAVVFPQDDGTGVSDGSEDYPSAGFLGLLSQALGGSYVADGLTFANHDAANDQVDVTAGHAYIVESGNTVQSGSQSTYDTTLPSGSDMAYVVVLPTDEANLGMTDSSLNDVWLAVDPTANETVYIRHGTGLSAPSDPSVKLGQTNPDDASADTRANDDAAISVRSLTDGAGQTHTAALAERIQSLIDSPNGHIPTAFLDDTESAEISVAVPDGSTLTVYAWGGYKLGDSTAPTGLDVELLDDADTVQATENTVSTTNTSGVTSHTNSSGSTSIFKLRVANDTGSDFTTDGVGAHFGYEVR